MIHERVYTTVVRRADVNAHIYSSYRREISISQVLPLCLKYCCYCHLSNWFFVYSQRNGTRLTFLKQPSRLYRSLIFEAVNWDREVDPVGGVDSKDQRSGARVIPFISAFKLIAQNYHFFRRRLKLTKHFIGMQNMDDKICSLWKFS